MLLFLDLDFVAQDLSAKLFTAGRLLSRALRRPSCPGNE
jgi:hypothetical protein